MNYSTRITDWTCDRSDRRRAARRDVRFYHVQCPNGRTLQISYNFCTLSAPPVCRVGLTKHRALPVDELFPLTVCRRICLSLPGVSYRDILVRREEETQGGDVSTMRVWVYCASPR
jgi:hypothetical protein